ncbi:MAG: hypothetical protein WCE62_02385, partial [Polyangiales bacterium]
LKLLQDETAGTAPGEVLRTVLAIVLDPQSAAWCLGLSAGAPVVRWPSTLYRVLARTALESSAVWRRCSLLLDRTLEEALRPYAKRSPAELAEVFLDGRESLSGDELAALLWCLIRGRSASHDMVADRLGLELEIVAARRLHVRR